MRNGPLTYISLAALVPLCVFLIWTVMRYGREFHREMTGQRKLFTLVSIATKIAVIVNMLVATFMQPLPALPSPPPLEGVAHHADGPEVAY